MNSIVVMYIETKVLLQLGKKPSIDECGRCCIDTWLTLEQCKSEAAYGRLFQTNLSSREANSYYP